METIQDCLLRHARHKCLPYLLGLPELQPYLDEITFILVGSVATGLCTERSDIDIALVCDSSIYDEISIGTEWGANRPSEVLIDGIQLHYYGISFAEIEHRLVEQDDIAIYVYGNAVVLRDPLDGYSRLFGFKSDNRLLRKQRIEGKLDMALRRLRALNFCIDNEEDVLNIAAICLELIRLLLKIIALLDNVQFDPRKRFFKTALTGTLGSSLKNQMHTLIVDFRELELRLDPEENHSFSFSHHCKELLDLLCSKAEVQGFQIGLKKPDHRHFERL
jgi:predicted nucleotidyltransferase